MLISRAGERILVDTVLSMAMVVMVLASGCESRPDSTPGSTHFGTNGLPPAAERAEEMIPPGGSFKPMDVTTVLAIYAELTGAHLDVDDRVRQTRTSFEFRNLVPMTRSQAIVVVERALLGLPGVVVTHRDPSHILIELEP
ncbi:MAG TPA: hypothetical protein VN794_03090 [Methylomirabilota bacterium]|nr:hypothetical protein [Methylomirabilota bacterium]